ncbi:MAG: outer membrane beta-barrel protein, partial [Elusimicrobiota bacterium]|nr:outer membrane beta-barrel protein [Elusimicrobiota bacterium]
MKKLFIAAAAVFAFAGLAQAEFGIGIKAGAVSAKGNMKDIYEAYTSNTEKLEVPVLLGFEGFFEKAGGGLGLRISAELAGADHYEGYDSGIRYRDTVYTYKAPLTLYYKYGPRDSIFHFWAGGGATYMLVNYDDSDMSASKVFPHVKGGIEFRFTKLFGLGL